MKAWLLYEFGRRPFSAGRMNRRSAFSSRPFFEVISMSSRPNILLINVDQQRYDSLGFTGNPITQTPHLDQLASRGLQFPSAYTPLGAARFRCGNFPPTTRFGFDSSARQGMSPPIWASGMFIEALHSGSTGSQLGAGPLDMERMVGLRLRLLWNHFPGGRRHRQSDAPLAEKKSA